jgi:hypothetical protein
MKGRSEENFHAQLPRPGVEFRFAILARQPNGQLCAAHLDFIVRRHPVTTTFHRSVIRGRMLSMVDSSAPDVIEASGQPAERNDEYVLTPAGLNADNLAPARGIFLGVLIGAASWVGIALAIWLL